MMLIYDLCYRLYFWLKRICRREGNSWVHIMVQKVYGWYDYYFGLFLNKKMVLWFDKHPVKWGLNTKQRDEQYTVSLTSFPARINYVHIAIETLMRQSFKPDRIVLWLADSQFPDKKLPEKLVALKEKGLTIRFCEDLRSHKKYFYTFREYPSDNVILADDDLFYPHDMVKLLARWHKKYPADIVNSGAVQIWPTMDALPSKWIRTNTRKHYFSTHAIQPYSGQGTLYPAKWYPQEIFNKEDAMTMAGTADDLWLKAMSLISNTKNTLAEPHRGFPVGIHIDANESLMDQNCQTGGNKNDTTWHALVNKYDLGKFSL